MPSKVNKGYFLSIHGYQSLMVTFHNNKARLLCAMASSKCDSLPCCCDAARDPLPEYWLLGIFRHQCHVQYRPFFIKYSTTGLSLQWIQMWVHIFSYSLYRLFFTYSSPAPTSYSLFYHFLLCQSIRQLTLLQVIATHCLTGRGCVLSDLSPWELSSLPWLQLSPIAVTSFPSYSFWPLLAMAFHYW